MLKKFSLVFCALSFAATAGYTQDIKPGLAEGQGSFPSSDHYSPYAGRNFPTDVFWGDTHLHTGNSLDAGSFGARLTPVDAYRFARGRS